MPTDMKVKICECGQEFVGLMAFDEHQKAEQEKILAESRAERDRLKAQREGLLEVLKAVQFGFMLKRCPICAGWNMSPNGETDKVHTKYCPVAVAILEAERP